MNLGKINLITPPDRLYNSNVSYLLVKPSTKTKMQFQNMLTDLDEDVNVYVYDDSENDIDWLLGTSQICDFVVIDIDNCDQLTKLFIAVLLTQPNAYYITTDEITPYKLISRNRIYNFDWINEVLNKDDEDDKSED
jgi:DNA integrity scanning protein DisA with diadenylate cyclase activity